MRLNIRYTVLVSAVLMSGCSLFDDEERQERQVPVNDGKVVIKTMIAPYNLSPESKAIMYPIDQAIYNDLDIILGDHFGNYTSLLKWNTYSSTFTMPDLNTTDYSDAGFSSHGFDIAEGKTTDGLMYSGDHRNFYTMRIMLPSLNDISNPVQGGVIDLGTTFSNGDIDFMVSNALVANAHNPIYNDPQFGSTESFTLDHKLAIYTFSFCDRDAESNNRTIDEFDSVGIRQLVFPKVVGSNPLTAEGFYYPTEYDFRAADSVTVIAPSGVISNDGNFYYFDTTVDPRATGTPEYYSGGASGGDMQLYRNIGPRDGTINVNRLVQYRFADGFSVDPVTTGWTTIRFGRELMFAPWSPDPINIEFSLELIRLIAAYDPPVYYAFNELFTGVDKNKYYQNEGGKFDNYTKNPVPTNNKYKVVADETEAGYVWVDMKETKDTGVDTYWDPGSGEDPETFIDPETGELKYWKYIFTVNPIDSYGEEPSTTVRFRVANLPPPRNRRGDIVSYEISLSQQLLQSVMPPLSSPLNGRDGKVKERVINLDPSVVKIVKSEAPVQYLPGKTTGKER